MINQKKISLYAYLFFCVTYSLLTIKSVGAMEGLPHIPLKTEEQLTMPVVPTITEQEASSIPTPETTSPEQLSELPIETKEISETTESPEPVSIQSETGSTPTTSIPSSTTTARLMPALARQAIESAQEAAKAIGPVWWQKLTPEKATSAARLTAEAIKQATASVIKVGVPAKVAPTITRRALDLIQAHPWLSALGVTTVAFLLYYNKAILNFFFAQYNAKMAKFLAQIKKAITDNYTDVPGIWPPNSTNITIQSDNLISGVSSWYTWFRNFVPFTKSKEDTLIITATISRAISSKSNQPKYTVNFYKGKDVNQFDTVEVLMNLETNLVQTFSHRISDNNSYRTLFTNADYTPDCLFKIGKPLNYKTPHWLFQSKYETIQNFIFDIKKAIIDHKHNRQKPLWQSNKKKYKVSNIKLSVPGLKQGFFSSRQSEEHIVAVALYYSSSQLQHKYKCQIYILDQNKWQHFFTSFFYIDKKTGTVVRVRNKIVDPTLYPKIFPSIIPVAPDCMFKVGKSLIEQDNK